MDKKRIGSILKLAVFDVAGPLAVYQILRSAGFSTVSALILSGILPAIGVIIGAVQQRRVDAVGVLVLAGIVVGAVLGLVSHNPKLVLDEGSVGTGVFGLLCLGSLVTSTPLMYRLSMQFIGPDSKQGREFTNLWQHQQFRHVFRVITAVWGVAYVLEAGARVLIVQETTAGTALTVSKIMPYAVAAVLVAWNVAYGRHQRRRGERLAAAAAARTPADDLHPASALGRDPAGRGPRYSHNTSGETLLRGLVSVASCCRGPGARARVPICREAAGDHNRVRFLSAPGAGSAATMFRAGVV